VAGLGKPLGWGEGWEGSRSAADSHIFFLAIRREFGGHKNFVLHPALKQSWLEQNQKLSNAQARVDQLYFDISRARATNQIRVYDTDSFASNRVEVESEYVSQKNELAGFKRMDQETLRQALSSLDTNSMLAPLLSKLNHAGSDLLAAKLAHGPDAQETRDATLVVNQLEQAVSRQVTGILLVKENQLAGLKSWLDEANARMKTPTAAELDRATAQYAEYTNALQTAKQLAAERESLEANMRAAASKEAIVPTGVTVELIDPAETPLRPCIPNGDLCLGILGAGVLSMLAGWIVELVGQRQAAK
jgi:fructose-specific component phosphotransferase system IIB-like protein